MPRNYRLTTLENYLYTTNKINNDQFSKTAFSRKTDKFVRLYCLFNPTDFGSFNQDATLTNDQKTQLIEQIRAFQASNSSISEDNNILLNTIKVQIQESIERDAKIQAEAKKVEQTKDVLKKAITVQKVARGMISRNQTNKTRLTKNAQEQSTLDLTEAANEFPSSVLSRYVGPFSHLTIDDAKKNYTKKNALFDSVKANEVAALVGKTENEIKDVINKIIPEPSTIWKELSKHPNDKRLIEQAKTLNLHKDIEKWIKELSRKSENGTVSFGADARTKIETTFELLNKINPNWATATPNFEKDLGLIGRSYFIGIAHQSNPTVSTSVKGSGSYNKFSDKVYENLSKPTSAPASFMSLMTEESKRLTSDEIIGKLKKEINSSIQLTITPTDQTPAIKNAIKEAINLGTRSATKAPFGQMQYDTIIKSIRENSVLRGEVNVDNLLTECIRESFLEELKSLKISNLPNSLEKFNSDLAFITQDTSTKGLNAGHQKINELMKSDNSLFINMVKIQSIYKRFSHFTSGLQGPSNLLETTLESYYKEMGKQSDVSAILSSLAGNKSKALEKEKAITSFMAIGTDNLLASINLHDKIHAESMKFLTSLTKKVSDFKNNLKISFLASEVPASESTDPKDRLAKIQKLHLTIQELESLSKISADFDKYPLNQGNTADQHNQEMATAKEDCIAAVKETAQRAYNHFESQLYQYKDNQFLTHLAAYQTKGKKNIVSGYDTLINEMDICRNIAQDIKEENIADEKKLEHAIFNMKIVNTAIVEHLENRFRNIFNDVFSIESTIQEIESIKKELNSAIIDPEKEAALFNQAFLNFKTMLNTELDKYPEDKNNNIYVNFISFLAKTAKEESLFDNPSKFIRDRAKSILTNVTPDIQNKFLRSENESTDSRFKIFFAGHTDLINTYLTENIENLIDEDQEQDEQWRNVLVSDVSDLEDEDNILTHVPFVDLSLSKNSAIDSTTQIKVVSELMKLLTDKERDNIRKQSEGLKESIIRNIRSFDVNNDKFEDYVKDMLNIAYPNNTTKKIDSGTGTLVTASHEFMDRIINSIVEDSFKKRKALDTQKGAGKAYRDELLNILNNPTKNLPSDFQYDDDLIRIQQLTRIFRLYKPDFGVGLSARIRDSFIKDAARLDDFVQILSNPGQFDPKYLLQKSKHGIIRAIQDALGLRASSLETAITGVAKALNEGLIIDDNLREAFSSKLTEEVPRGENTLEHEDAMMVSGSESSDDDHDDDIKYTAEAMICQVALGKYLQGLTEEQQTNIGDRIGVEKPIIEECLNAYKNRPYFGKDVVEFIGKWLSIMAEKIGLDKLIEYLPKISLNSLSSLSKYNQAKRSETELTQSRLEEEENRVGKQIRENTPNPKKNVLFSEKPAEKTSNMGGPQRADSFEGYLYKQKTETETETKTRKRNNSM